MKLLFERWPYKPGDETLEKVQYVAKTGSNGATATTQLPYTLRVTGASPERMTVEDPGQIRFTAAAHNMPKKLPYTNSSRGPRFSNIHNSFSFPRAPIQSTCPPAARCLGSIPYTKVDTQQRRRSLANKFIAVRVQILLMRISEDEMWPAEDTTMGAARPHVRLRCGMKDFEEWVGLV